MSNLVEYLETNKDIHSLILIIKYLPDADGKLHEYRNPVLSSNKKYCDWGKQPSAKPNIGDWVPVTHIEVIDRV